MNCAYEQGTIDQGITYMRSTAQKRKSDVDSTSSISKKRRPNAAGRERQRLRVFNEALEDLQSVIPIRLTQNRKLHKKQTLQLAIRYINFLHGCMNGERQWEERNRFWCKSEDELMMDAIDAAGEPSPIGHLPVTTTSHQQLPMENGYNCQPVDDSWNTLPTYNMSPEPPMQYHAQSMTQYQEGYQQYTAPQFPQTFEEVQHQDLICTKTDEFPVYNSEPFFAEQGPNYFVPINENTCMPDYSTVAQDDVFHFISSAESVLNPDSPESGFVSTASYDL
uniref:Twist-like1a n=1 Tax=Phallusia mammillata TaxID=59560 RepID=A0A6F9DWH4_9ASCI|nr:Twist-like1a [Phallusia mammillata]